MHASTKPFQIARVSDRAISAETQEAVAGFGRYCEERDFSALAWRTDELPTVYWGRPLTVSERRIVGNKVTVRDQYEAAFCFGLMRVQNLETPDGQFIEWTRPSDRSGKDKPVLDSDLDLYFDEATVQEIGMVIMRRSFLARTRGHWYPLPDICRDALSAALLLRAGRTSGSSRSDATSPPAEAPPATAPTSSPAGDASTGATATG